MKRKEPFFRHNLINWICFFWIGGFCFFYSSNKSGKNPEPIPTAFKFNNEIDNKIWISMGLCWSNNTKYHGKSKFPYKIAAKYSSQLWIALTPAKVILQIIYTELFPTKELLIYKEDLEQNGIIVKLVFSGDVDCILKTQLIRILAFELPEVSEKDIVITADVDAFIGTPDILNPIKLNKKIWIFQYKLSQVQGYTFMLSFIGALAYIWRDIIEYDSKNKNITKLIQTYNGYMNFSKDYLWDIDQRIVTHSILKSKLCTLPASNALWKELSLNYEYVDDHSTCWHGGGVYGDCNNKLWSRNILIRYHGNSCKWWHFYPDETEDDLKNKFQQILSGNSEYGIVNSILQAGKSFQLKAFGKSFI